MPIFLLKANHGFIETEKVQHTGVDGNPLEIVFVNEPKSIVGQVVDAEPIETKQIEGEQ